jgi:hypothetical protein
VAAHWRKDLPASDGWRRGPVKLPPRATNGWARTAVMVRRHHATSPSQPPPGGTHRPPCQPNTELRWLQREAISRGQLASLRLIVIGGSDPRASAASRRWVGGETETGKRNDFGRVMQQTCLFDPRPHFSEELPRLHLHNRSIDATVHAAGHCGQLPTCPSRVQKRPSADFVLVVGIPPPDYTVCAYVVRYGRDNSIASFRAGHVLCLDRASGSPHSQAAGRALSEGEGA